jgi:hypothetical protein
MTYCTTPRSRLSLLQIPITIAAIFCFFGWMQERDERAREVTELHQTLAALDAECTPIIELSMPVDMGTIQL